MLLIWLGSGISSGGKYSRRIDSCAMIKPIFAPGVVFNFRYGRDTSTD